VEEEMARGRGVGWGTNQLFVNKGEECTDDNEDTNKIRALANG
jgi:hypothetical protein